MLTIPCEELITDLVGIRRFADEANEGQRTGQRTAQGARTITSGHQTESFTGDQFVIRIPGDFAHDVYDTAKAAATTAAVFVERFIAVLQQGFLVHLYIFPGPLLDFFALGSSTGKREAACCDSTQSNLSCIPQKLTTVHFIHLFHDINFLPYFIIIPK